MGSTVHLRKRQMAWPISVRSWQAILTWGLAAGGGGAGAPAQRACQLCCCGARPGATYGLMCRRSQAAIFVALKKPVSSAAAGGVFNSDARAAKVGSAAAVSLGWLASEQATMNRLAWLAALPEYAALSATRIEDLLVVHGVPGNPFLPLLPRPGEDRSPWVQTDARAAELLGAVDADVVVARHTHTVMCRRVPSRAPLACAARRTLIVNPGSLSYGRGRDAIVGRATYALLDWSAATGWQATLRAVRYDPGPVHAALLALRGDYPGAAYIANRLRPPGAEPVSEQRLDFIRFRWGDAPAWWEQRDELPAWRALRGE